ncbi:MAG TPA: hypothetical protein VFO40_12655 [Chthoniobacterales bacterium]|nr:hypothetical protein [Chthoniobacterales bacterium]
MRTPRLQRSASWLLALLALTQVAECIQLTDAQAKNVGMRLWQNESGGSIAGLTAWNAGEDFASLGIGHFIWYPEGKRGPFEESFPLLVVFLQSSGASIPSWLSAARGCPWSTRAEFLAATKSPKMEELRALLVRTIGLQARFAANRLDKALSKMLAASPAEKRALVQRHFARVAALPSGAYALVDYVNFKGEGTLETERYKGEGWGLLQVLETMGEGPALQEFSRAADKVLTRRVQNSPPERGEQRWLAGWRNRVRSYSG